ncbi:hypothetical protein [Morganella psychrotolerans]|uniref:hypothetical protein n=1 Tax=Morganella psychrotolerans TaxID=368603 RepID=UPI0039AF73BB
MMWAICGFLFRNISTAPLPVSHKTGKIRDNSRLIGFLMAKGLWNGTVVTLLLLCVATGLTGYLIRPGKSKNDK